MSWIIRDTSRDNEKEAESRSEAEERKSDLVALGANPEDIEIIPPNEAKADGGTETLDPDVIDHSEDSTTNAVEPEKTVEPSDDDLEAIDELGESLDTDPLSILPGYMITPVDGKPSLNKRGVSVLAYQYGVDVIERETVAYPHETDYESAIVEIIVENEDGRTFVGSGEAHVDETPKHQLLRMAETRAYKRAVIFATGTGIVGYQEIMEELQ